MNQVKLTFDVGSPPTTAGLTVEYSVPSGPHQGVYIYSEFGGPGQTVVQQQPYVDPDGSFTMTSTTVTRAGVPLQVIFRHVPGWASAIFECCDAFSPTNQDMMPGHGDSNTVTITDQTGAILATIPFWGQWAGGRWRWQSGPWPFPKDPATLQAKGLLPRMDPNALHLIPGAPKQEPYLPMHLAPGWPLYLGGGGDPCMLSIKQGYWASYPTPANLTNMLNEAEGLAAYPWFMRDLTTGSVPDIWNRYPTKMSWMPGSGDSAVTMSFNGTPGTQLGTRTVTDGYGQRWLFQWQPYANINPAGTLTIGMSGVGYPGPAAPIPPFTISPADGVTSITADVSTYIAGSGLVPDEAHSGSMWALPWIATGDPYFLEALHAKYFSVWAGIPRPVPRPKLSYEQIRQTAWQLTSLMISAATTPAVTPQWILPRSLWQTLWADEMRLWQAELVNGTTPGSTVFHIVGATAGGAQSGFQFATWQEDMLLQVMSWAAMLMPDCRFAAEWKVQDQIARTNGTSGWCNYAPESYYLRAGTDDRTRWYQSWAEMWAQNAAVGSVPTPPPTTMWSSEDYCSQLRAGMALASQAGVGGQELKDCLAAHTAKMWAANYHDVGMRLFAG